MFQDFQIFCNIWKGRFLGFSLPKKNTRNESPSLDNSTHKWLVSLNYQKNAHEYEIATSNATVQTFIRNGNAHEYRVKMFISAVQNFL